MTSRSSRSMTGMYNCVRLCHGACAHGALGALAPRERLDGLPAVRAAHHSNVSRRRTRRRRLAHAFCRQRAPSRQTNAAPHHGSARKMATMRRCTSSRMRLSSCSRRRAHSRCRTRARRRACSRRCRSCCVRTCGPSSCAILSVTLSTARRLNAARARMRAHRRGVGACVRDGRDGARRRWRGGEWGGRGCLSKRTLQVWLAQPVTSRS